MTETVQTPSKTKAAAGMLRGLSQYIANTVKEDLTQEQAVFQIKGSATNIAWTVGHLAATMDHFVYKVLSGKSITSEQLLAKVNMGVTPTNSPDDYPPVYGLLSDLKEVFEETAAYLELQPDSVLETPLPDSNPLKDHFGIIENLINASSFHVGYHCGQITLLRKAQGLEGGFGL